MMTPADFRRIALSLKGVEEYSHAGFPGFRVGGRKFASLASQERCARAEGDSLPVRRPPWQSGDHLAGRSVDAVRCHRILRAKESLWDTQP